MISKVFCYTYTFLFDKIRCCILHEKAIIICCTYLCLINYVMMNPYIVFIGQQVLYGTAECTPRTYCPQRRSQDRLYPRHCSRWLCPTIL